MFEEDDSQVVLTSLSFENCRGEPSCNVTDSPVPTSTERALLVSIVREVNDEPEVSVTLFPEICSVTSSVTLIARALPANKNNTQVATRET